MEGDPDNPDGEAEEEAAEAPREVVHELPLGAVSHLLETAFDDLYPLNPVNKARFDLNPVVEEEKELTAAQKKALEDVVVAQEDENIQKAKTHLDKV